MPYQYLKTIACRHGKLMRVDGLGKEAQFITCDRDMPKGAQFDFEALLTKLADGYTKTTGQGGWKGTEEPITIYKVAGISDAQCEAVADWLLTNSTSTDIYVLHPNGEARGYSRWPHHPGSISMDYLVADSHPLAHLRHHVTDAIERGEKQAIVAQDDPGDMAFPKDPNSEPIANQLVKPTADAGYRAWLARNS